VGALAELLQGCDLRRLDEVGQEVGDADRDGVGIRELSGLDAVELVARSWPTVR